MKISLKAIALTLILIVSVVVVLAFPNNTFALDCINGTIQDGGECAATPGMPTCMFGAGCAFNEVINTLLFLLGAASVLMLIYGGIRYTLSGGNRSSVTTAKNTILYAIIGLVVAMLAFAISNFVVSSLTT